MDIQNSFDLTLDPALAWKALLDIKRIMPCIPGAELLEASDDGSTYKGRVSVKLGPVALTFVGTATFAERDETARRAKLKARGSDSKGRGGVQADVTFQVKEADTGSHVTVLSQVNLTGAVAQYGRGSGVIQGVAAQIINQFSANLEASISAVAQSSTQCESAQADRLSDSQRQQLGDVRDPLKSDTCLESTSAPAPLPRPILGFSLLVKVVWNLLTGVFRQRS